MKGDDVVISSTTGGAIGLVTSDETWLQNQPKESILLFRGGWFQILTRPIFDKN
jgi:hypothetical protein